MMISATVWSSPAFPLLFSMLKFFIDVPNRSKENWSFPEAHGSQCQGPRGRLRVSPGQAGRRFCRGWQLPRCGRWWRVEVPPWSTPTLWRCAVSRNGAKIRQLLEPNRGGSKRVTKTGSPGQDYGWGNELANYGEYSGAPSTEAGKTYENRYPHDFNRYGSSKQIPSEVSRSNP